MFNKSSERSDLSDVAQASALVREVAPVEGATVGERILIAARKVGWGFNRTRDVWYEQARRIDAREMDQLREARQNRKLQEATNEYRDLRERISRLEAALSFDADFYRPHIDALEQSIGGPRSVDRARIENGGDE